MPKLIFPENETARLVTLGDYQLMDSGEDVEFDAIARIAGAICGIPIALITFIDSDRQYFKSHIGTEFTENLREFSFCTHAIAAGEEIMVVSDATKDERFVDNPMVTGPTKLVFYAGVPLINEDGHALGTICVLDQQVHELSHLQTEALKSLAKQVVDKIELKQKVAQLERSNRELKNANVLIQKFASMAAHDIKNPLGSILMGSQLLKKTIDKTGDARSLKLVDLNISSAKNLLILVEQMLEYSKSPGALLAKKQEIDVQTLFDRMRQLVMVPDFFELVFSSDLALISHSAVAIEQILLNLINNAVRYNDKQMGSVRVKIFEQQNQYCLEVFDNGMGIAEEYFDKIFESNFTVGTPDRAGIKGTGIGLSTVKDLVNILGGTINLESEVGIGSTFVVKLNR